MDKGYYEKNADAAKKTKQIDTVTLIYGDHMLHQVEALKAGDETPSNKTSGMARMNEALDAVKTIEDVFQKKNFIVKKRINYNTDCDVVYMANSKFFLGAK